MLKPGLISCWNKKQNMKSYLPADKHCGSNLNLTSHIDLPYENFAFLNVV